MDSKSLGLDALSLLHQRFLNDAQECPRYSVKWTGCFCLSLRCFYHGIVPAIPMGGTQKLKI